jgi:hypothetical protein
MSRDLREIRVKRIKVILEELRKYEGKLRLGVSKPHIYNREFIEIIRKKAGYAKSTYSLDIWHTITDVIKGKRTIIRP